VGTLLAAQNRHPCRPAHVHVLAHKQGFKTLINQTYVDETDYLTSDVQFGVTEALIGKLEKHTGPHPEDGDVGEWYTLETDADARAGRFRTSNSPDRVSNDFDRTAAPGCS
jgi:catechol 1,2-dioxygenase